MRSSPYDRANITADFDSIRISLASPEKIAPNIFYHSLLVPKIGWLRTGYQGCIRAVRKKLQEIQPDIVHSQGDRKSVV